MSKKHDTVLPPPVDTSKKLDAPTGETPVTASEGSTASGRKVPQRGTRKRVLGEGQGDYLIYEMIGDGHPAIPRGSLVPIPQVPQFEDTAKALAWLRNESGDLLSGKQVMVFRACEILSLTVQQQPKVVISSKPKVTVTKAPETSSNG